MLAFRKKLPKDPTNLVFLATVWNPRLPTEAGSKPNKTVAGSQAHMTSGK